MGQPTLDLSKDYYGGSRAELYTDFRASGGLSVGTTGINPATGTSCIPAIYGRIVMEHNTQLTLTSLSQEVLASILPGMAMIIKHQAPIRYT